MIQVSKEMVDLATTVGGFSSGLAVLGALAAIWQLQLLKQQSRTAFEDNLVGEYRRIVADLPLAALLGEVLTKDQAEKALPVFYRYFDLCNQQAFLHQDGRVATATWDQWKDGIQSNMRRPAFAAAWAEIAARANGDFAELRALCPPPAFAPKQPAPQEAA